MQLTALLLAVTLFQGGGKLEIKDTKLGTGAPAKVGDTLVMNYTGKLTNGKVFDTSKGKSPFVFTLGQGEVIPGWDKGLVGIKPGGKRTLTIPAALGYGAQGSPPAIPPNATLVFDVELVKIEKITVKILKAGTGSAVEEGDSITVKYAGSLKNGKQFDAGSLPVEVGRTGLIKGFTQGLMGMKVGEKRRITIPPALGYGAQEVGGGLIPANSTLIFDLELVKKN
ncbi:MAG: FKBP-type peptidyl-prolyl cis-trans isomerase [Fimbriimonas sp.]